MADSDSKIPATPQLETGGKQKPKTWTAGTLVYTGPALVVLFLWLLFGDFAWSMRDRSVGPMAYWYLKQLNVSNLLFGLLVSTFPGLIGLFLGPVISYKSDRYRSRWGRRIPFLMVTTPIAALGMVGLGLTPIFAHWLHGVLGLEHAVGQWLHAQLDATAGGEHILSLLQNETVVSVFCFGIFWSMFEFATIAGQAVFGGLINDVVPKPLLGRFYGLFRAVSLIDGIVFNYWVMGKVPTHFTLILCIVGVFYGVAFLWVCFKVKEGEYPPPPPPDPNAHNLRERTQSAVGTYFRECFTNSYYVSVFLMLTMAAVAFQPINTFAIPYATSLGMSMDMYGKCLSLTFFTSLCISYFLGWLADVFHPIRVSMVALFLYLLVAVWGWLFATTPDRFAIAFVAHGILSGCYFTSAASLGQRLYPHSKFAQFASAAGMFTSLFAMGLGPLLGLMLDWTGKQYRHTFIGSGLLALTALLSAAYVYTRFLKLGGPKNYVAPE